MNPLEAEYSIFEQQRQFNKSIDSDERRHQQEAVENSERSRPSIKETGREVFNILRQHDISWGVKVNGAVEAGLEYVPSKNDERQKEALVSAFVGALGSVALAKLFGDSESPKIILEAALRSTAMKAGLFALDEALEQRREVNQNG